MPQHPDPRLAPTLPAQQEREAPISDALDLFESTSSQPPPMHHELTHEQLLMQDTLPPAPMVGNARELLALAGEFALDNDDARASQRNSHATEYRGGAAQVERLGRGTDTDRAPRFHLREISDLTDDEVARELTELIGTEGAHVERRILLYLSRRHFTLGLAAYGPVSLHDGRNNVKEMREEAADFLFYFGKEQLEQQCR